MSNRDPLYNSKKADATDPLTGQTSSGSKDDMDQMKDEAQHKVNDAAAKADEMANKASHMADDKMAQANEMADKAQHRADEGMGKAGDAMDRGAGMLRERGEQQGGTVGQVADTAADAMESAGSYLQSTDTGEMMDQVEAYIRQNPTQSLLIAAGVGFVLARAIK